MRLFAALPLPSGLADALAPLLAELRTTDWPVRWVADENLHLTLKFFGEVEPAREPAVAEALRGAVQGTGPIDLMLAEPGVLPPRGRARVVVVDLEAPPALELLQHRIERAAEPLGFSAEGRPFRPHLTLGRVRREARLPAGAAGRFRHRLELPWLADRVVLYESAPSPAGQRYDGRVTFDLEP